MIFNNKKGAEIALNAIIIAVILLVVAFVIIFIFVSKTGKTTQATETCSFKGGQCTGDIAGYEGSKLDCPKDYVKFPATTDCDSRSEKQVCCIQVIGK